MTIEERAKVNLQYERDFLGNNLSENMVCRAYVKGATEQKAEYDSQLPLIKETYYNAGYETAKNKMIDKACEWLINTYLGDYVTDENGNGGIGDNVKLAEDFRKAMED